MSQISSSPGTRGGQSAQQQVNIPLIVISVSLALLTVILYNFHVHSIRTAVADDTITVFKLTKSVEPGDTIDKNDIKPERVPASARDQYEALRVVPAENIEQVLEENEIKRYGRVNEFVTYTLFTRPGADNERSVQIREGYRGVTIPVSRDSAVASLDPGDMVDISGTFNPPGRRMSQELVMERVRVLAVGSRTIGSNTPRRRTSYSSIMIEIKPEEELALRSIQRYAVDNEFAISERNPSDTAQRIPGYSINPELLKMFGLKMESPES